MSKYSGKCDFYDDIAIHGLDYILRSKVHVGDSKEPLQLNDYKDCIPYFPYIVSSAGYDKEKGTIFLTTESWVDIEEKRIFDIYLDRINQDYRRCKRKKEEFNIENIYKKYCYFNREEPEIKQLVQRVAELGNKATSDGIHNRIKNALYREPLYEEMVKNGYSEEYAKEWIYGKENK